jgi:hypothetical protein
MFLGVGLLGPLGQAFAKVRFPGTPDISHTAPEAKLKVAVPAAACLTVSTFWWAWTSGPNTHYMVSVVAGLFFGFGLIITFSMFEKHHRFCSASC